MLASDVIYSARIDLKDNFQENLMRWPESDLFDYIKIASEELTNAFPYLSQSTAEIRLAPGVFQEIPSDWKSLIRIELNSENLPVNKVDRDTSNAFYQHKPQSPSGIIKEYWTDIKAARTFYVNPPANDNATVVAQGSLRQPQIVSPEQELVVVDEAIGMLVNGVLSHAYRKDSEVASAREVAEYYYRKWREDLGLKAAIEAINTLPANQVVPAIAQIQTPVMQ